METTSEGLEQKRDKNKINPNPPPSGRRQLFHTESCSTSVFIFSFTEFEIRSNLLHLKDRWGNSPHRLNNYLLHYQEYIQYAWRLAKIEILIT